MIIHNDTNLPISFLSKALAASKAVVRIILNDGKFNKSTSTGLVVQDSLLITCGFVIPDPAAAKNTSIQFDYFVNNDGSFNNFHTLKLDPDIFFATSRELDITIVGIQPNPEINISEHCLPAISRTVPLSGENVNVIHHPLGEALKISFRDGKVSEIYDSVFFYDSPTLPGSTGAPVFNDNWELIGIHQSADRTKLLNCAIRISAIMQWLDVVKAKNSPLGNELKVAADKKNELVSLISSAHDHDLDVEERDSVFISYSHKDQEKSKWQDRLELHLRIVQSIGSTRVWQDDRIQAGSNWKKEIELALKKTKVAILLIGPYFLNSQFILNKELPELLAAAGNEGVRIFPLITHGVLYQRSILSDFQPFNKPEKPLHKLTNENAERVLVELVEEVAKVYEE